MLAPLRMVLGFTSNELAVAVSLLDPGQRVTGSGLKNFERCARPAGVATFRRSKLIAAIAEAVIALMDRSILSVPETSSGMFHSKLDKRDTEAGWESVASDARGVPYSALLYQRLIGGVWLVVQAAYSEAKGDALLEKPVATLLVRERIPFYRSRGGAGGALEAAQTFGLSAGPDFLLPVDSPTVVVETKMGEDGGTVRDKAARFARLAEAASARGLVRCALSTGRWRERPNALVDVVIATGGRAHGLSTLEQLLGVPEIAALRGSA